MAGPGTRVAPPGADASTLRPHPTMVVDDLRIYDEQTEAAGGVLLPECTGLWWARTAGG